MTDETRPPEGREEEIRAQVEDRIAQEVEAYPVKSNENGKGNVSSGYLEKCLYANQLGLGLLYAALLKDKLAYNNSGAEWLKWGGQTWERDIMQESYAATEDVVDRLLEETVTISEWIATAIQKKDTSRVDELSKMRDLIY